MIAGEPVASLGGFTGRETVLTNSYLARLISRGEARYFLLGGQSGVGGPGGTSNAAVSTITSICKAVSYTSSSSRALRPAARRPSTTVPARPKRLQALVDARGGRELLTQLGQFSLVGVSNTAISFVVFAALRWAGTPAPAAAALGFIAGALNGYWWNGRWTFAGGGRRRSVVRYGVVQGAGAGLSALLVAAGTSAGLDAESRLRRVDGRRHLDDVRRQPLVGVCQGRHGRFTGKTQRRGVASSHVEQTRRHLRPRVTRRASLARSAACSSPGSARAPVWRMRRRPAGRQRSRAGWSAASSPRS